MEILQRIIAIIKASRTLQFIVVFFAGAIFAAVFYPTKQIKESLQKTYQQQINTLQEQHSQALATQQASYQTLSSEYINYKTQTTTQINDLTNQVSNLRSHTRTTTFKIVHPDGTVEERDTTDSSVDQSDQITQQIQQEWQQKTDQAVQTATQTYQQQITTLQTQVNTLQQTNQSLSTTLSQSKTETINPKNFTLDLGMLTNADYYSHITYNFWGPLIIGGQAQFGASSAGGLSLGLRF